jgi:hypothetical protein
VNRDTVRLLEEHDRARQALLEAVGWPGLESHLAICPLCRKLAARLERLDQMTPKIPPPRPGLLAELMMVTVGIPEPRPGLLEDLRRATSGRQSGVNDARVAEFQHGTLAGRTRNWSLRRLLLDEACPGCGMPLVPSRNGDLACSNSPPCIYIRRDQQQAEAAPVIRDGVRSYRIHRLLKAGSKDTGSNAMDGQRRGVLLVVDDVAIAALYARKLGHYGFEVSVTGDVSSALKAFQTMDPAVVCLDGRLPGAAILMRFLDVLGARIVLFTNDQSTDWIPPGVTKTMRKLSTMTPTQFAAMIADKIGSTLANAHSGEDIPAPGSAWTRR